MIDANTPFDYIISIFSLSFITYLALVIVWKMWFQAAFIVWIYIMDLTQCYEDLQILFWVDTCWGSSTSSSCFLPWSLRQALAIIYNSTSYPSTISSHDSKYIPERRRADNFSPRFSQQKLFILFFLIIKKLSYIQLFPVSLCLPHHHTKLLLYRNICCGSPR